MLKLHFLPSGWFLSFLLPSGRGGGGRGRERRREGKGEEKGEEKRGEGRKERGNFWG